MKTSVIPHRVADFLKRFPPFDVITQPELLDLASSGRVKFHQLGEYVCRQGDPKGQLVWVIQQGRVELLAEDGQLHDVLGEGALLGLERFSGVGACLYTARTASDVILYGIAAASFESVVARHPAVQRFISAHSSVSGVLGFSRTSWLDAEAPPMDFLRARLTVISLHASRIEAAHQLIGSSNGVAAFLCENGNPLGIISPVDLCAASTGSARLAARPCPPAIAAPLSTRAIVREMMQAQAEEIVITADGTPDRPLQAVLTASDLALFCGHNPVRLINGIRHAGSVAEMTPLLQQATRTSLEALAQPLDVDDCCRMGTEIISALANACIRLASAQVLEAGVDPPSAPYCWLMFGASARGELMKPALATIAAVYDDSGDAFQAVDRMYFAAVAGEALGWFHACGLFGSGLAWPEGSQPCMPLSEWTRLYSETIRNPLSHDLYARREFFDVSPLAGDVSILKKVHREISLELHEREMAIMLLANDTLTNLPPLTFFDGLVLDLDGAQRDTFDIEETAVNPITDAARVFAIAKDHLTPANTLERLRAAEADFPEQAAVFREAAGAFRIALYYRALAGGSQISAAALGRFDQRLLKTAFSSIHRLLEFTAATFIPAT